MARCCPKDAGRRRRRARHRHRVRQRESRAAVRVRPVANSAGVEKDPIAGNHTEVGEFAFPAKPARRRLEGLHSFVVTKGGEHVFLPGIGGLRWLAEGRW
jgi:hypothetical protein